MTKNQNKNPDEYSIENPWDLYDYSYDDDVPEQYKRKLDKQKNTHRTEQKSFTSEKYVIGKVNQDFLGVEIFSWKDWEDGGKGRIIYKNCQFNFPGLEHLNKSTIILSNDGTLEIWNKIRTKKLWDGYALTIPQIREAIKKEIEFYDEFEKDNPDYFEIFMEGGTE